MCRRTQAADFGNIGRKLAHRREAQEGANLTRVNCTREARPTGGYHHRRCLATTALALVSGDRTGKLISGGSQA